MEKVEDTKSETSENQNLSRYVGDVLKFWI